MTPSNPGTCERCGLRTGGHDHIWNADGEINCNFCHCSDKKPMKIHLSKSTDALIGAVRVTKDVYEKLDKIAKTQGVSKQEVIRAILIEVIDQVEV